MSSTYKFLLAAAAVAVALPAGAQVAGVQTGVQPDVQTGVQADVETGVQADVQTGVQADADVGADAQADTQTTDVQADTQADVQAETQADVQAGAQADAAAQGEAQAQPAGGAGAVTVATAADIRAGVTVQDPQGGTVGTIESVDAEGAVVSTGNVRAKLPLASFGKNDRGLVISMTRGELEAAVAAQDPS